jgi:hypothetical protein
MANLSTQRENVSQPPATVSLRCQIVRRLVVVAFVACWMALDWIFKLEANLYLLLGVVLTAAFQIAVARRPIRALWVRSAPPLRINVPWLLIAAALAALPVYEMYNGFQLGWVYRGWMACAILGAPAAAYAIQNCDRSALKAAPLAAGMVVAMSALMVVIAVLKSGGLTLKGWAFIEALRWTLLYFPVCFMLEEVTFRGALDSYLWRPGEKGMSSSTPEISFLWGLWHLPIVTSDTHLLLMALLLGCFHMLPGIPLSLSWRICGNLLVPALAHAALDGVRNVLL